MVEINEKFYSLEEEKQLRIINAAMEVFSKNDYNRAVTDDIAAKADISKGLLFHYFKNKKTLYMFIYQYAMKLVSDNIDQSEIGKITDFFDLLDYGAEIKINLLEKNPFLMDFCLRCFYNDKELISDEINEQLAELYEDSFELYFSNLDLSKFKRKEDVYEIYKMSIWMCDGYMHEKRMKHEKVNIDELLVEFNKWMEIFKNNFYK
ncbi:TetR/AcrR family transcriptional regulator [Anaerofustis stercorihominis]|uniref:Transcriptional regulator, TetR family n=2 Tax=Anaerofustis stercorihominis TaxID=214853 RepID=B1C611_9FIRM|nr:TetR/AcrR family transcriptional regulator [Anaerofustis stercorihominis]EDS73580.1 transcriptional regulator, TetR family [Anaerofustis stercorihominis DSM 17244]MCQ4794618.1 TetR/AcrR family transcriptional regulator [Anaerofustis stercorihominis]